MNSFSISQCSVCMLFSQLLQWYRKRKTYFKKFNNDNNDNNNNNNNNNNNSNNSNNNDNNNFRFLIRWHAIAKENVRLVHVPVLVLDWIAWKLANTKDAKI